MKYVVLFFALLLAACAPQQAGQGDASALPALKKPAVEESVESLLVKAEKGDRTAQFMLGEKACCTNPAEGVVLAAEKNQIATSWYCAAARGGMDAAFYKLGEIYSGDLFNLPALEDYRAPMREGGLRRPVSLALMWYQLAAEKGHAEALGAAIRLKNRMREEEAAIARQMKEKWQEMPCLWGDVMR